jgi:hypothetical protein
MTRSIFELKTILTSACALLVAGAVAGCADVDPPGETAGDGEVAAAEQALAEDGAVEVTVTEVGPNQYVIVATATFDHSIGKVWATLHNFEKLAEIGLPGVAADFQWLNGGSPGQIPSTFQFAVGDTIILEEVYARDKDDYTMRYHLLEPALGIVSYDALFELAPISNEQTAYSITREVTLEPGVIDGLAGLIAVETQNMQDHFAKAE